MKPFLNFKSNVFLAPMAGITDAPMRRIVHQKCADKVNIEEKMQKLTRLQTFVRNRIR